MPNNIWLMGGGYLIACFLEEQAIDEFVVIGESPGNKRKPDPGFGFSWFIEVYSCLAHQ